VKTQIANTNQAPATAAKAPAWRSSKPAKVATIAGPMTSRNVGRAMCDMQLEATAEAGHERGGGNRCGIQNLRMDNQRDVLREEEVESRWEAAPAVFVVIGLQLTLALVSRQLDWKLWYMPWWVWILAVGPEVVLLVALVWDPVLQALERVGHRRNVALILLAIISVENAVALVALLGSLISGQEHSGGQLLLKGMTIWGTNVIAYALWFWGIDRGGPVRRRQLDPPPPDFQFPQMENPQLAAPGWHPRIVDYVYISFTNSIAFSPTDAMPLSRRTKLLMLSESAVSAISILLVTARSVNIFK